MPPRSRLYLAPLAALALSAAHAQSTPLYTWTRSLPVDFQSPAISTLGGTETRSLVTFDGKLFAGIGYWRDTAQDDPKLPGAQVLVLDSAHGTWRADLQLDDVVPSSMGVKTGRRRYLAIGALASLVAHQDATGHALAKPVPFLLASVWDRIGGIRLFARGAGANVTWQSTDLDPAAEAMSQVRSFGTHIDTVTHREIFFAGSSPNGVYSGTPDGSPNFIHWNDRPEAWDAPVGEKAQSRVMAFAECNGKLYATSGFQLYERQDGPKPFWKKVFTDPNPSDNPRASGFRGLHVIPAANGGQQLLIGVEAFPSRIFRIDPRKQDAQGKLNAEPELDVSAFLTRAYGTRTTYSLPAYNDMLTVQLPGTACDATLIGYESTSPKAEGAIGTSGKYPYANFFVRHCGKLTSTAARYTIERIEDPAFPKATLEATRAIVASPFADDPAGTLYTAGLDAGNLTAHNTAWIYKGVPAKP